MSNLHAYADDHVTLNLVPSFGGISRVRPLVTALAASIRTEIERRQTQRFVASLPDHLLQDFGYERDWDGTIRSLRGRRLITPVQSQRIRPMPKVFPHLWFKNQAEEAMDFYTSVFKDSKVLARTEMPDPELSVVRFELAGQPVVALNANSPAHYNESFSFLIETADQAETDYFWNALIGYGGKEQPCGWLTDKFGVYWQVSPTRLLQLIADPDREKAGRVMQAMYKMKKIVIADLETAYRG